MLADGQPTSTAAQLSAIQIKLNALDAQFAATQTEFGTVPALLQAYIGYDITADVPDFDDQLRIILKLDTDCAPTYSFACAVNAVASIGEIVEAVRRTVLETIIRLYLNFDLPPES